jgi:hypothetical protein
MVDGYQADVQLKLLSCGVEETRTAKDFVLVLPGRRNKILNAMQNTVFYRSIQEALLLATYPCRQLRRADRQPYCLATMEPYSLGLRNTGTYFHIFIACCQLR